MESFFSCKNLKDCLFSTDREWIEKTIARNDKDGDGGISLEEFIEMNTKSRLARSGSKADSGVATTLDKAKLAFNAYDRNRDGYLTKAELRKTSKRMTDAQIDAVFEKYDKNKVTHSLLEYSLICYCERIFKEVMFESIRSIFY